MTENRRRLLPFIALLACFPGLAGARCLSSDQMQTGSGDGPWYRTVSPSEHYDSARSQRFPDACSLRQIATSAAAPLAIRRAPGHYPALYNIATREMHELFVYGGYAGQGGSYVAKLDADTLVEQWRAVVEIDPSRWSFVGAMGVLADGYVYSVQSNVLAKLHPHTGEKQELELPQLAAPTCTGAAYNGFVVTPDGLIVTKSMERGPCERDTTGALDCVLANRLPSTIAVVDPASMTLVTAAQTTEPALGRIATERHDGTDYIYIPGISALVRYTYAEGTLSLDESWGPVPYGATGANASGVGVLGDYVIAQTNYLPSSMPSWIVAANIHDGSEQHATQPFLTPRGVYLPASWVPDKAALDVENGLVFAKDMFAGQVAALSIGPEGFELRWKVSDIAKGFPALVGPPQMRQLVVPALVFGGDTLAWRDTHSGHAAAQSPILAPLATIGASAPGFKGRFYYPSFSTDELVEVSFTDAS